MNQENTETRLSQDHGWRAVLRRLGALARIILSKPVSGLNAQVKYVKTFISRPRFAGQGANPEIEFGFEGCGGKVRF